MPPRASTPPGAPCWLDIITSDQRRARTFYPQLFGWTADDPNPGLSGYVTFRLDGEPVAGCMARMDPSQTNLWWVYLASDDAATTVERARACGGVVQLPPMTISDVGTLAFLRDPAGAGIGVWQPGSHAGFAVVDEPGAPSWFELHTGDVEAAADFYREAFGWTVSEAGGTDPAGYALASRAGDESSGREVPFAGITDFTRDAAEGSPAVWEVYFAVADVDATVARALELGGSVERTAEDTPSGRIATLRDTSGIRFRIRRP